MGFPELSGRRKGWMLSEETEKEHLEKFFELAAATRDGRVTVSLLVEGGRRLQLRTLHPKGRRGPFAIPFDELAAEFPGAHIGFRLRAGDRVVRTASWRVPVAPTSPPTGPPGGTAHEASPPPSSVGAGARSEGPSPDPTERFDRLDAAVRAMSAELVRLRAEFAGLRTAQTDGLAAGKSAAASEAKVQLLTTDRDQLLDRLQSETERRVVADRKLKVEVSRVAKARDELDVLRVERDGIQGLLEEICRQVPRAATIYERAMEEGGGGGRDEG